MLDELCALTGWTRRHARRALGAAYGAPERRQATQGPGSTAQRSSSLCGSCGPRSAVPQASGSPRSWGTPWRPWSVGGSSRRAGGPIQAPHLSLGDDRPDARTGAEAAADEGAAPGPSQDRSSRPDPHPDLRGVGRPRPGSARSTWWATRAATPSGSSARHWI